MDARIAPPFMEATDASRLVCVVVVSYQEYSLTHTGRREEAALPAQLSWSIRFLMLLRSSLTLCDMMMPQ